MKVSWKWLNELIDIKHISLNEITKKLILAGFEIEDIINKPEIQDKTIDISITTNRGDTSSIVGLAREISILFNLNSSNFFDNPYLDKNTNNKKNTTKDNIINHVHSNALLNFKFNTITKLQQKESPIWLKNYLKACDIQPNHILCDIEEYIKIKWGQSIDIFDLDKINQNNTNNTCINIKQLKEKEQWMDILDSYDLNINTYIELLKYNNVTLSIIGTKSNPNFQCDSNTSSIIILGEKCKIQYLKKIIEIIKSNTEKLNRHLKYTSTNDFINAYNETIQLISCLTRSKIGKLYTFNKENNNPIEKNISVDKQEIIKILGPLKKYNKPLSDLKIFEILQQLNFQPEHTNNTFKVTIPEYRQEDIKESIDIIEEIGRVYGFDKFLDKLPLYNQKGQRSDTVRHIEKIRNILSSFGLHEIVNYSLEDQTIKYDSKIKLYNTLLEDQSQLKDNLIRDLIIAKEYNTKKKNLFLEFFEIGRIFYKQKISRYNNKYKYIEKLNIAGILGNSNFSRRSWKEKSKSMSWFQAKGVLEDFLDKLNTNIVWIKPKHKQNFIANSYWNSICHPHRVSILCNQQTKEPIGIFSELNTKFNNAINSDHRTYIFELNLFNLIKTINKTEHLSYIYTPYSNYPSITRDISLKLNKNKTAKEVQEHILNLSNPLIKSVNIFNEYNNNNDANEYRNIGLRITYQSNRKTLNEKDIDNINNEITELLESIKNHNRE